MKTIENGIRGYSSNYNRSKTYYEADINWREAAILSDRATALYDKRWQAACEVIDIIAAKIGLDAGKTGNNYYGVNWNHESKTATSPLADRIDEWFDKSGDKVKLKKRIAELEQEVEVLKRILKNQ